MKIAYSVSVQNGKEITTISIKRASEIPLNLLVLSPLVHLDCPSQLSHQPLNTRFSFLLCRNNRKKKFNVRARPISHSVADYSDSR